jgi:hypothetical protein
MCFNNLRSEYSRFPQTFLIIGFTKQDRIKRRKKTPAIYCLSGTRRKHICFPETTRTPDIALEFE